MIVQPHEAYAPDVTIDLTKHHKPETWTDSIAFWTVKSLRLPTDLFFRVLTMFSLHMNRADEVTK